MPTYFGLLPSAIAIRRVCHQPLDIGLWEHQAFAVAVYVFDRAREIDEGWAKGKGPHPTWIRPS